MAWQQPLMKMKIFNDPSVSEIHPAIQNRLLDRRSEEEVDDYLLSFWIKCLIALIYTTSLTSMQKMKAYPGSISIYNVNFRIA